jgi:hypothetical protein
VVVSLVSVTPNGILGGLVLWLRKIDVNGAGMNTARKRRLSPKAYMPLDACLSGALPEAM